MMSQLGEFSFLLAAAGLAVAAISPEESKLIISVTVLSLALSPFWLATARRLQLAMERPLETWRQVFTETFVEERVSFGYIIRYPARLIGILGSSFTRRKRQATLDTNIGEDGQEPTEENLIPNPNA